jgi:hypothetical protein
MKQVTEETRRRMSESASRRCTDDWKKKASEQRRSKIDGDSVRELYQFGMTQEEVARVMGVTQKVIFNAMKRLSIPRRRRVKRNQKVDLNSSWKGSEATYAAFHYRIKSMFGSPKKCEACGTTSPDVVYDWANMTGNYEDPSDYKRMCRSCHFKHDNLVLNLGPYAKRKEAARA